MICQGLVFTQALSQWESSGWPLVSSPPGKYCQWFGVGVRTCCCLLIPTHSALLHARLELWPQHRCAWSKMYESGISLFSLLNSFIRAASFHNPWQGILTLCLDSKTQSLSCRCSQTLSLVPLSLIQHRRDQERQFYCCFRGGGNREEGEGNLCLDNSWI